MFPGGRLRELRQERDLSLRALAEKAGISSFGYIANIERGVVDDPSIKTVIKLAKGLEVSIDYLVNGEEHK